MMGAPSDFDGEDWEAKMEAKLQDMYAKVREACSDEHSTGHFLHIP